MRVIHYGWKNIEETTAAGSEMWADRVLVTLEPVVCVCV